MRVTLKGDQRYRLWQELRLMDSQQVWGMSLDLLATTLTDRLGFTVTPSIAERARKMVVKLIILPAPPTRWQRFVAWLNS